MFVWLEGAGYLRVTAAAGVQLQLENMGEVGNVAGGTVIPAGSIGAIAGPRGAAPALEELTEQISYKVPVDRVSAVHVGSTLGVPAGAPDDELWGSLTVDGTATSDGERILLTNQTDATFNGIWIANAAYWERAEDFDEDAKCIPQSIVPVIGGTTYSDTVWMMTNDSVSLGVTNLAFSMIADIGGLQGEIDAPRRGIGHIGRHQLLAEKEARLGSEFDPRAVAKPNGCAIDDHHIALAELENEGRHFLSP
jgi:hypothetical protein